MLYGFHRLSSVSAFRSPIGGVVITLRESEAYQVLFLGFHSAASSNFFFGCFSLVLFFKFGNSFSSLSFSFNLNMLIMRIALLNINTTDSTTIFPKPYQDLSLKLYSCSSLASNLSALFCVINRSLLSLPYTNMNRYLRIVLTALQSFFHQKLFFLGTSNTKKFFTASPAEIFTLFGAISLTK